MQSMHLASGGRYPILRSIGIIYVILGAISVLAGVVAVLWFLFAAPFAATDRVILAAAALVGAVFTCALMLGAAEIIKLFVNIEHNTRMAALHRPLMPGADIPETAGHMNRISVLEEETAEAALLRGH